MPARTLTLLLLAAAVASVPGERLRPARRAGELRRVEFEQSLRLEMVAQEDSVLTKDEESPASQSAGLSFVVEEREQVVFVEEVLAAGGSDEAGPEPRALRRSFERLESRSTQTVRTAEGKRRVTDGEGRSPLAGRRVRFERAPDAERWTARFDDEQASAEGAGLLDGLVARWELAEFLPPGPVAPEDEWRVPNGALRALSYPGGELGITIEGDDRGDAFGQGFHDHMRGEIRARYMGPGLRDGRELALVRLEARLETSFELLDDPRMKREYAFELELTGDLWWDVARGRAVALDWGGPVEARTVTTRLGAELGLRTRQRFEGSLRFALRVGAEDAPR